MTRPSTIAALAVIVCAPGLVAFADGQMTGFDLALWYLAALVVSATGLHLVSALVSRYAGDVIERERSAYADAAGSDLPVAGPADPNTPVADSQNSRQPR